jgi:hypothetical protein
MGAVMTSIRRIAATVPAMRVMSRDVATMPAVRIGTTARVLSFTAPLGIGNQH